MWASSLRYIGPGEASSPYLDFWSSRPVSSPPPDNKSHWTFSNKGRMVLQFPPTVIEEGRLIFCSGYIITARQPLEWLQFNWQSVYSYAKMLQTQKQLAEWDRMDEPYKAAHKSQFVAAAYFLDLPQFSVVKQRFFDIFYGGVPRNIASTICDTKTILTRDFLRPRWKYDFAPGP